MTIKTECKTVQITLRKWVPDWNAGYEPDCFDDMETCFPMGRDREPGTWAYLSTGEELENLISWWEDAVICANRGEDSDAFCGLRDDEIDRGVEWCLDVEEIA